MSDNAQPRWVAASFCYADHDPNSWAPKLGQLAKAGFGVVDIDVPWRLHAPNRDAVDFGSGLALGKCLDAVRAAGLFALLRVGPALLWRPQFGLPDWLLATEAAQTRGLQGAPQWVPAASRALPALSYDADAVVDAVAQWMGQLANQVAGHEAILAVAVELGDHWFFRDGIFDGDYSDAATARWRSLQANEAEVTAPPTDARSQPEALAWARFKRMRAQRVAARFAAILRASQLGQHRLLAQLDCRSDNATLTKVSELFDGLLLTGDHRERTALIDVPRKWVVRQVLAARHAWLPPTDHVPTLGVALVAAGQTGDHLTLLGEPSDWQVPQTTLTTTHRTLAALPPVASTPRIAVVRATLQHDLAQLATPLQLLGAQLVRYANVQSLATTALASGANVRLGWQQAVVLALRSAQLGFDWIDDTATAAQLANYRLVIVPDSNRLTRSFATALCELTAAKRAVVVMGPAPVDNVVLDERGHVIPAAQLPAKVGRLREASCDDIPGLAADMLGLAQSLRL